MMFRSVDLPQPEWPMIETYSPGWIVRLMSRSTSVVALPREKDLSIWSSLRKGLVIAGLPCGQEAAVPRVTMDPSAATSRSSTKPTAPM